jgi:hypothetical protein
VITDGDAILWPDPLACQRPLAANRAHERYEQPGKTLFGFVSAIGGVGCDHRACESQKFGTCDSKTVTSVIVCMNQMVASMSLIGGVVCELVVGVR